MILYPLNHVSRFSQFCREIKSRLKIPIQSFNIRINLQDQRIIFHIRFHQTRKAISPSTASSGAETIEFRQPFRQTIELPNFWGVEPFSRLLPYPTTKAM